MSCHGCNERDPVRASLHSKEEKSFGLMFYGNQLVIVLYAIECRTQGGRVSRSLVIEYGRRKTQ